MNIIYQGAIYSPWKIEVISGTSFDLTDKNTGKIKKVKTWTIGMYLTNRRNSIGFYVPYQNHNM